MHAKFIRTKRSKVGNTSRSLHNRVFTRKAIWGSLRIDQVLIGIAFILCISVGYFFLRGLKQKTDVNAPTPKVVNQSPVPTAFISPTPTATVLPTPSTPSKVKLITFTHRDLPGFSMQYPADWQMQKKDFDKENTIGIESTYSSGGCGGACMGVKLAKDNTSLELVFEKVWDNNGIRCSDTVSYQQTQNNWHRIKDSKGIFYSPISQIAFQTDLGGGGWEGDWLGVSKEWSVYANHTYKICIQGYGPMLQKRIDNDYAILLEFPKIKGNPDVTTLKELDKIVSSIQGLEGE